MKVVIGVAQSIVLARGSQIQSPHGLNKAEWMASGNLPLKQPPSLLRKVTVMNLKQLAQHLGVSPATVSRVLGGKSAAYRIGTATQQKILAAAQDLGVTVNHQARGLRLRTTHTLGLIVPDISNPFFAAFCRRVEQVARPRGYSVLVADSQESTEVERDVLQLMRSRSVDGLIIAPVSGQGEHLKQLIRAGQPLVLVDRVAPGLRAPSVVLDNVGAARAGVRLLAAAGHRQIACLQGLPGSAANQERVSGYRAELTKLGLRAPSAWITGGDYTVESGRLGTLELLRQKQRPTAILALGNLLALGALEAARAAGLSVPGQVSLVSFDEQPWAAALSPALTTISQPVDEMGEQTMALLFRSLSGSAPAKPPRIVLPFSIMARASVTPCTEGATPSSKV